jgi:hypothetical protein
MSTLSWDGPAYIRRLRTEHAYYVTFDELGGEDNIAAFRTALRRAAKAEGMRVHTFRGAHDPVLWINDPDYTPSPEEVRAAMMRASEATRLTDVSPAEPVKLRVVD